MEKINLPNLCMYQFSVDTKLVDDALDYFLKLDDINYKRIETDAVRSFDVYPGSMARETDEKPYIPLYHKELFEVLYKCINEVSANHFTNVQLGISDSWLTKTNFGEESTEHFHQCSIFSGLLYCTDHPRSETLFYTVDEFHNRWQQIFPTKQQNFTYKSNSVKGKLLIFPSTIKHKISRHSDKKIRHTFAFNTWINGMISDHPTRYLESNLIDPDYLNQKY